MLQNNRFDGKINDKSIGDFTSKLNYDLGQADRIELVNEIVNTQETNGKNVPDKFFEEFFDQKDTVNGIDPSHIKICLSQSDGLSDNNAVCKALERMADYILFAPDGEKIDKKTKYNFYTEDSLGRKMSKEPSLEGITKKVGNSNNNVSDEEVIDFLISKGKNFKKSIQQKIYKQDIRNDKLFCVKDYDNMITQLQIKAREAFLNGDIKTNRKLNLIIASMRDDEIICKDKLLGTIYFKQPLHDSTETDYSKMDYTNKNHVMALLKVNTKPDFDNDLYCLSYDLNLLLEKCDLTIDEKQVLELWRINDCTQEYIAECMGIKQQSVNSILNRICGKISDVYKELYHDWYYLNIEKGTYKKCSTCGKVLLVSKFSPDISKKDGYKNICKNCRKK
jgi:predicted DNA-binding protein (UPF0251 family)